MKSKLLIFVAVLVVSGLNAFALSPLPPKTLDERVESASYVFFGRITNVELKRSENEFSFGIVTYTVMVENVIYPQGGWHSHTPLKISGIHGIEFADPRIIGESLIFIVNQDPSDPNRMISPDGRDIKVPPGQRDDVIRSLYRRLYKNEPNK
jgi:hypothetical protein